jgi:hypothetical protein
MMKFRVLALATLMSAAPLVAQTGPVTGTRPSTADVQQQTTTGGRTAGTATSDTTAATKTASRTIRNVGPGPTRRIRNIQLTSGQTCPKAEAGEVVVCGAPEEPYRIPKQFRDVPRRGNDSWVNRASEIDDVSRVAGGLPDTCSPVGSGGQSGCSMMIARQYAADRRARRAEERAANAPQDDSDSDTTASGTVNSNGQ